MFSVPCQVRGVNYSIRKPHHVPAKTPLSSPTTDKIKFLRDFKIILPHEISLTPVPLPLQSLKF